MKYFYDEYRDKIKLLVSGSSAFYLDRKFKDSLAGRKKIFNVNTLSFREFLRFKNKNDLARADFTNLGLKDQETVSILFNEYLIYGGYPRVVLAPTDEKEEILRELAYSYVKKDIYEADIGKEEAFYKLLKILAMQVGNLVNASELAATLHVSKSAIDNYFYVLEKSFHLTLVKPFYRNMRKELTKMPKVYFLDLGLRNFFSANFAGFVLRGDKGMLLENAVFRLLLDKYGAEAIRFWRTTEQKEIDFVLEEENLAYEVKTGSKKPNFANFRKNYPNFRVETLSLEETWQKLG